MIEPGHSENQHQGGLRFQGLATRLLLVVLELLALVFGMSPALRSAHPIRDERFVERVEQHKDLL